MSVVVGYLRSYAVTMVFILLLLFGLSQSWAADRASAPSAVHENSVNNEMIELQKLVREGDAEAQYKLGVMYDNGVGVPKDLNKAFELISKAAAQGFSQAQSDLCLMYNMGWGTPRDDKKAFLWCTKAAKGKFPDGVFNLGYLYLLGYGVNEDISKGTDLVKEAASLKNARAIKFGATAVSGCLRDVKRHSPYQIAQCFFAANIGDTRAAANTAYSFYRGVYVDKDFAKAAFWFSKAARGGTTSAQAMLGIMYAAGQGVPKDNLQAYAWLTVASASQENQVWKDKAVKAKNVLEKELSTEERTFAIKKALEYQNLYSGK